MFSALDEKERNDYINELINNLSIEERHKFFYQFCISNKDYKNSETYEILFKKFKNKIKYFDEFIFDYLFTYYYFNEKTIKENEFKKLIIKNLKDKKKLNNFKFIKITQQDFYNTNFLKENWKIGEEKFIEYFSNEFYKVKFFHSDDKNLIKFLELFKINNYKIAIDFEWEPDRHKNTSNPISLIQIGTNEGAAVIKLKDKSNEEFLNFLKNTLFIGKGISCDKKKIKETFGENFIIEIEDIENTELKKRNLSLNYNNMVETFYKKPILDFKDKKISRSKWNLELNNIQVIYAAYDVISLYNCYQKMEIFLEKPIA